MTNMMRTTSIRFKSDNEMCRAFSQLGLNLRCEDHDTQYWDGYTFVYDSIAKALQRHGIKCEVSYEWYTKLDWNASYEIKEAFKIDGTIQMNNWSLSVITYDKSKAEHKKEVRKIYRELKKLPFEIEYGCESEKVSNDKC